VDKKATAEYGQKCSQAAFVLRACHKLLPTLTDRYQARQSIQLVSQPLEGRAAASQRHGRGGKGETSKKNVVQPPLRPVVSAELRPKVKWTPNRTLKMQPVRMRLKGILESLDALTVSSVGDATLLF